LIEGALEAGYRPGGPCKPTTAETGRHRAPAAMLEAGMPQYRRAGGPRDV